MNTIRILASIVIFSISLYLTYDLFTNGFSWAVIIVIVSGYIIVHFIWPKNKTNKNDWLDILEIIIDLPYRVISYVLRSIGRLLRGKDGDIGLDIDL